MLDKDLIKQKIDQLLRYLEEISPILKLPYQRVYRDLYRLRTVERNIQLIVDTAVDINTHILLEVTGKVPDKNVESFLMLGGFGMFPPRFLRELAQSAGFRNRIVHEYERTDPYILFRSAQKFHRLYFKYCDGIMRWLKKHG